MSHYRTIQRRVCRRLGVTGALAVALVATACEDFHLAAHGLEIAPRAARPGDTVIASFVLQMIPAQSHTLVVVIDTTEHLRVTSSEARRNPVILELGDAADLLARYGPGEHAVHVQVHANRSDESTRTQWTLFQLLEDTP